MLGSTETLRRVLPLGARALRPGSLSLGERQFSSEIAFLLMTFFFVYIGLALRFSNLALLGAGLRITFLLFLGRRELTVGAWPV